MVDSELVSLVALMQYGVFRGSPMRLRQRLLAGELPSSILQAVSDRVALTDLAESHVAVRTAVGERLLSFLDSDYPAQLRDVHDFPLAVSVRGVLAREDPAICAIGGSSGEASAVATQAARAGWTVATDVVGVLAGLGGRTVAITASTLGALSADLRLTPLWPEPPYSAALTAYASATIMLSGNRPAATHALGQGRPVVFSAVAYNREAWARDLVNDPAVLAGMADTPEGMVAQAISLAERQI